MPGTAIPITSGHAVAPSACVTSAPVEAATDRCAQPIGEEPAPTRSGGRLQCADKRLLHREAEDEPVERLRRHEPRDRVRRASVASPNGGARRREFRPDEDRFGARAAAAQPPRGMNSS